MIIEGVLELLFKAGGGESATFCIPGSKACFEPPQKYLNDTITEKLRFFTCAKKDDMRIILKALYDDLVKEQGLGCLLVLYSLVISRGLERYSKPNYCLLFL